MIQKAKKLVKLGAVTKCDFNDISLPSTGAAVSSIGTTIGLWLDGKCASRFSQVDYLVEFCRRHRDCIKSPNEDIRV